jgi:hypothetical protein
MVRAALLLLGTHGVGTVYRYVLYSANHMREGALARQMAIYRFLPVLYCRITLYL